MTAKPLFGAAYYPEYTPDRDVRLDLDLMASAGMDLVRVGESVWSTWEPEDGRFDLDWLQETLDACAERGIAVVLGTPTYAVPLWLARAHPDIAARSADGGAVPWGARQEVDFTNPVYLRHAERIIRAVVGRYAAHPAVIGYQVDNEPGNRILHNDAVFDRFLRHLEATFGDVAALNDAWGLTHWSHRLSRWSDLWRPGGNMHPQYDLAWRRFQAELTTEFITWQARIVREVAEHAGRTDQFVTTCVATDVAAIDELGVCTGLDVAAGNPYYPMQDHLALPAPDDLPDRAWMVSGTWQVTHLGDRMWAFRQAPFLVTETNAGSIGDSSVNWPAWDGQWRQLAWSLVSRGARAVEYWQWGSLRTGTESPWTGILPHDGRPGRMYAEVARTGHEIAAAAADVSGLLPHAEVGLLYSVPSKWALAFQPPWLPTGTPYAFFRRHERAYDRLVGTWGRAVFDAGLQTRVLHDRQLVDPTAPGAAHAVAMADTLPVLVVPGFFCASEEAVAWLRGYVHLGGHLVLSPRALVADSAARYRDDPLPGGLSSLAGVTYQESANLDTPIGLTPTAGVGIAWPTDPRGRHWVDYLVPGDAEVLAGFDHPQYSRFAAVTTRRAGAGRVTVVGTELDPASGACIADWAVRTSRGASETSSPLSRRWGGSDAVRVASATNDAGARVHVVHHWAWGEEAVTVPVPVRDALSGQRLPAGAPLQLSDWDVRVLVEDSDG